MKKKFSSLALLVTLSTAIASQDQISTEETEEQKVETIINPCVEFSQAPVVDMMQSVS